MSKLLYLILATLITLNILYDNSNSTYWRKKDSEKAEIFLKIEPYLTFLNVNQLERQGADIQTKME